MDGYKKSYQLKDFFTFGNQESKLTNNDRLCYKQYVFMVISLNLPLSLNHTDPFFAVLITSITCSETLSTLKMKKKQSVILTYKKQSCASSNIFVLQK